MTNRALNRGKYLTELRRSSASGTHGKTSKDRYNRNREAIEEATEPEEDMSILDIPTAEDLSNAEDDYWEIVAKDFPDEHFYSDPDAYSLYDDDGWDYEYFLDDYWDE